MKMILSLLLFLTGILGFVLNRKNIILMIIAIEMMLLAVTFLILINSFNYNDNIGQLFSIFILTIAGAESVVGLSILVAYFRLKFSLISNYVNKTYSKNVKKLSNVRIARSYSTVANNNCITNQSIKSSIDPWFITGLFDGESSFVVTILTNSKYKTGWKVHPRVQLKMHEKDRDLIQSIQEFFGGIGSVSKPNKASTVEFRVSTLKDLVNVIIPHFDNYPLITKKHSDYFLFKQIVLLMFNKEHSTLEGIQKAVNFKASLNWGLSDELRKAFPNTIPSKKLGIYNENNKLYNNLHPKWIAGFSTGESNFFINVQKSKAKSGLTNSLRFTIAQHSKDLLLLESLVNFFGAGYVIKYKKRLLCEFIITKIDIIVEHLIPFFEKHPILGSKHLNFIDFKSAAFIIKNKEHLNEDGIGLEHILQLKKRITSRYKNKAINHSFVAGTEK
jgi:NADH:ubiquinone oxidoreductase subunit K